MAHAVNIWVRGAIVGTANATQNNATMTVTDSSALYGWYANPDVSANWKGFKDEDALIQPTAGSNVGLTAKTKILSLGATWTFYDKYPFAD